jgi:hypothetical protein
VIREGRVVDRFRNRNQKAALLLAYLDYEGYRAQPRLEPVELLWPECDRRIGRQRLNIALSFLARVGRRSGDCHDPRLARRNRQGPRQLRKRAPVR